MLIVQDGLIFLDQILEKFGVSEGCQCVTTLEEENEDYDKIIKSIKDNANKIHKKNTHGRNFF